MTKTETKIHHATAGELCEQRHLLDPLDYDGCPFQRMAAGPGQDTLRAPQNGSSGPPAASPVRGHHPRAAKPGDGRTGDRGEGS